MAPLAKLDVQVPASPFSGGEDALHVPGRLHVAAFKKPARQLVNPETMYPELQVGWQVLPLARAVNPAHVPVPPFKGAAAALQALALQVAVGKTPKEQVEGPDTVYPALHDC